MQVSRPGIHPAGAHDLRERAVYLRGQWDALNTLENELIGEEV